MKNNSEQQAIFCSYPDVVTIRELQQMLHISRHTAYDLIRSNKIPCRRIGRIYRIRKADIISFMQG